MNKYPLSFVAWSPYKKGHQRHKFLQELYGKINKHHDLAVSLAKTSKIKLRECFMQTLPCWLALVEVQQFLNGSEPGTWDSCLRTNRPNNGTI